MPRAAFIAFIRPHTDLCGNQISPHAVEVPSCPFPGVELELVDHRLRFKVLQALQALRAVVGRRWR